MTATSLTLVIADDDRMIRNAYRMAAERRGYVVFEAEDGEAAMRLVKDHAIDWLLLDILMPKKEGLETLVELKRDFPRLKIIAMSASGGRSNTDLLQVAQKLGADATLRKPFSPSALFTLVEGQGLLQASAR